MNENISSPDKTNSWLAMSALAAACFFAFIPGAGAADFALKFDGTNDFVTFGPAPGLGASNFTLEVWFMRQGTGITTNTGTGGITAVPLLTKGRAQADGSNLDLNYFLGIGTNNVLTADLEMFVGGTNKPVAGVTAILNDVWYHAAVTYDGTNWALYLNDTLETNVNVGAGVLPRYDSILHAGLATTMNSTGAPAGFFAGVLDEARIWNYARSQQEIHDSIRSAITNSTTGLLGRWGLDAGSGTTATNTANAAISGILSNGPTWVAGYPFALAGVGGLYFDGDNDYVTFGPTNALGLATFTIETWFKRTGTGKAASTGTGGVIAIPLVTKGRNESDGSNVDMNYFLGITTNDNKLCADFEQFAGGTNQPVVGVTTIATGVWYHAAATYDGSSWSLYLNGVLETNVFVGQTPRYDSIQHAALGAALNSSGVPNGAFQGVLDEVRLWNYARSASQIVNNQNHPIPAETGLVARWGVDEEWGIVAANSGTSLVPGTLTNGPTWVAGYPLTAAGVGGLNFDGVNDYVTFGPSTALGLSTFTIETWFKRTGPGSVADTGTGGLLAIPLVTKGRGEVDANDNRDMNYFLGITTNNNVLCADFEGFDNGTNWPVVGVTPITTGVWYHAAATYDGASWSLYLNGVLETNVFVGQTPRYDSIQHAGLGTAMNSTGTPQGFFQGVLDEVRLWDYARTASQVQSNMNYAIPSAVGLVGRWGLDEASGLSATNTGSSGVDGALANGPIWTAGYALAPLVDAAPATPVLGSPADGATNVWVSPTLSALVSDPEESDLVVTFYGRVAASAGSDFTIAVLPDTQFYVSSLNGGTPAMFSAQTDWIVSHRVSRHIAFVTHSGDCVNDGDSFESQWINATNSMYRLENPLTTGLPEGIPYGIAPGNHDQSPNGDPNGTTTFYNQYFGTNHFAGRAYYGGNAGTNNDSHFELFSAGGMDFVILHLEGADTSPGLLSWANGVLQAYGNRRAIVTSHDTIGTGNPGTYSAEGQARYNALKANPNFFLALCGHVHGESRRQDTFAGNTVNTLLADYQNRTNGGNGWMRLLEFSPGDNVINVKTYSPVLDQFETDADSQFALSYNMSGFTVIGVSSNVPSGSAATRLWPGLRANTSYEWYVTVSDGLQTVASATNHFTTSSGIANLMAAYPFDEGTGTAVADVSGNGNNGTTSGATWTNAGRYGNALAFNGTGSVVNIPDSPTLHLATAMTLEAWVFPTAAISFWKDIVYKGNDNYYLMAGSTPFGYPAMGGIFGSNGVVTRGTTTLPTNAWTHLAGTYDGATVRLYVNGLEVSSVAQTGSILTSTNPLQIGGDRFFPLQSFQGWIDEVRVYSVALTPAQIQWDMNTPVASLTNAPPLIDADGDGLADAWEIQYFGSTNAPNGGATMDADGDGFANLQEFQAGTDPTNSASAFRITALAREGSNIRVAWTMGADKTNALQATAGGLSRSYSTNNFADIFTITNTVGTTTNHLDLGAATNVPSRFYRVRLVP